MPPRVFIGLLESLKVRFYLFFPCCPVNKELRFVSLSLLFYCLASFFCMNPKDMFHMSAFINSVIVKSCEFSFDWLYFVELRTCVRLDGLRFVYDVL